jgi:hypothetical protein
MPTRQVESEHDEVRHSSTDGKRATAEAEPNHPVAEQGAAGVESPIAKEMQGASGLPRQSSDGAAAGLPPDTNQDDAPNSDQDIDTAGTEADEQSPTGNLFLALTPSLQRG